jgi:YD repeat-containing protein
MGGRLVLGVVVATAACATPFAGVDSESTSSAPPQSSTAPAPEARPPSAPAASPTPAAPDADASAADADASPPVADASAPDPDASQPAPGITGVDIDSPDECVVTFTNALGTSKGTSSTKLDPNARVIAYYLGGQTTAYRYDAAKRLVAMARWGPTSIPYQEDYDYDAHDNLVAMRAAYSGTTPFYSPATGSDYLVQQFVNTYDAGGALVGVVFTASGPRATGYPTIAYVVHENAAGHCEQISEHWSWASGSSEGANVKRAYDAAGRLWREDTTFNGHCHIFSLASAATITTFWSYDSFGRVTQKTSWCDSTTFDDWPIDSTTITYGTDGSSHAERTFETDVGGESPQIVERSAYCAVIDAWRGGPPSAPLPASPRCRVSPL